METLLLWTLHLAFTLLLFAAALAWVRRRAAALRYSVLALALLPLLALHGLLASKALALRFDVGVAHAPWIAATALLGLHLIGATLLVARSRRERWSGGPSAGVLLLCAVVALALDLSTLWNLELRARLRASALRFEAGRIAWRESPQAPAPDENAAPIYLKASQVFAGNAPVELDAWLPALGDQAVLDTGDAALRAALAGLGDELRSAREATRLEACWFEPEPGESAELATLPPVTPLIALAHALALEARVRAADGDIAGALADVDALFGLSAHLTRTPALISALAAVAIREVGVTTLAHVLSGAELQRSDLETFELRADPPLAPLTPRALAMEEAYGLGLLGWAAQGAPGSSHLGWRPGRIEVALYDVFLLEDDVAGYRTTMAELQAQAREPLAAFLAAPPLDAARIRSRGVLATLLVPNLTDYLLSLHRSDARMELARATLAAARHRAREGRYPTSLAELSVAPAGVVLEGDGTFVLLVRPDLKDGEGPLELRLPARVD